MQANGALVKDQNTIDRSYIERPITTHINLLVVGASRSGKGNFIQCFEDALGLSPMLPEEQSSSAAASTVADAHAQLRGASDPWGAFSAAPGAWRTTYQPLQVPGAGRKLVYSVQSAPGWGSTLDPSAWLEALVGVVMEGRQRDYAKLGGARGLHKSLVCGALVHSYTATLYFLPPTGPTAMDLVLMAALSQALPLVPVVGACWTAPGDQGEAGAVAQLLMEMEQLLAAPGELVPGLKAKDIQLPPKPAVKPMWLGSTAGSTGGADYGISTPVAPYTTSTHPAQASASLDVISLSSEEELPDMSPATGAEDASGGSSAGDMAGDDTLGDGLQKLLQLLAGPEVYCLLDASWDAYTSFCTAYEAAGRQLPPLVSKALQPFTPGLLVKGTAVKELHNGLLRAQSQAHWAQEAYKEASDSAERYKAANAAFKDQLRQAQAKAVKMEGAAQQLASALSRFSNNMGFDGVLLKLGPEATALCEEARSRRQDKKKVALAHAGSAGTWAGAIHAPMIQQLVLKH